MAFQWFTIVFGWASLLLCVAVTSRKVHMYLTMPVNLRWEVYPVPHEMEDRRRYGGSYMEQVDWARKRRHRAVWSELSEMASEVLLLKRVREHNPFHLWPFSMALHWGIYLLLLWLGLLAAANWLPGLVTPAVVIGCVALVLGAGGALGLIVRRATTNELALHTSPIDYFNLAFLAAIFSVGFLSWVSDPLFSQHRTYIDSLLSLRPVPVSPVVTVMSLLLQVFAIYMPFSKLLHPIMKHFTFQEVLWDDAPSEEGSRRSRQVARQLSTTLDWGGSHVVRGGTWLENVQDAAAGQRGRE